MVEQQATGGSPKTDVQRVLKASQQMQRGGDVGGYNQPHYLAIYCTSARQ